MKKFLKIPVMLFLCACAAGANCLLAIPIWRLGIPLFMDTLFTLTVAFLAGPFWGCISAVFTTFLSYVLFENDILPNTLFVLCSIGGVLLTDFFRRVDHLLEDTEGSPFFNTLRNIIPALLILSLAMCLQMSVFGGLIAWFIKTIWAVPSRYFPYSYFLLGLRINNIPVPLAEIIARIPVNIPDRLLSVYGAYGLALVLKKYIINPAVPGGS
jgi:hypothetical protein